EAGGDCEPQGIPQRSRQVLPEVAGPERRQESELDQVRKNPRSHRKADILPGRRPASGDIVRFEEGRRYREEARRLRRANGGPRLHRTPGPAARRVVYACKTSRLRRMKKWPFTSSIGA